ncbi:hypothetical protein GF351_04890 [Candidatus Woesearchaeota archaeon]|nr:hypothetical protein [Candidatus Woesearchaeota archaeon]
MKGYFVPLGLGMVIIGFVVISLGVLLGSEKSDTGFAVGGIIGFVPFGFGTDKRMVWAGLVLTALFFALCTWLAWR